MRSQAIKIYDLLGRGVELYQHCSVASKEIDFGLLQGRGVNHVLVRMGTGKALGKSVTGICRQVHCSMELLSGSFDAGFLSSLVGSSRLNFL